MYLDGQSGCWSRRLFPLMFMKETHVCTVVSAEVAAAPVSLLLSTLEESVSHNDLESAAVGNKLICR